MIAKSIHRGQEYISSFDLVFAQFESIQESIDAVISVFRQLGLCHNPALSFHVFFSRRRRVTSWGDRHVAARQVLKRTEIWFTPAKRRANSIHIRNPNATECKVNFGKILGACHDE